MSRHSSSGSANGGSRSAGSSSGANDRRSYRPVAVLVETHDEAGEEEGSDRARAAAATAEGAARVLSRLQPRPHRRRAYRTVASDDHDDEADSDPGNGDAAEEGETGTGARSGPSGRDTAPRRRALAAPTIGLTILDGHQTKFRIPAHPDWTVGDLKTQGQAVHGVPVLGQRLIYRGKLLQDDAQTLAAAGLAMDGLVLHMFPRPRVVLRDGGESDHGSKASGTAEDDGDGIGADQSQQQPPAAHVPTIVLNADEAERRSQILVLGSVEYMEAQSNVKLFSFMLLMVSTMELLNLLAIFLGVPQSDVNGGTEPPGAGGYGLPVDDVFLAMDDDMYATARDRHRYHDGNGTGYTNQNSSGYYNTSAGSANDDGDVYLTPPWQPWDSWSNLVDLALSLLGVYVGLLGLRAASETRRALAWRYLLGTLLVGVGWMLLNYYLTVQMDLGVRDELRQEQQDAQARHGDGGSDTPSNDGYGDDGLPDMSDGDIYRSALSVMVLPGLVWFMCCLRAGQFHHLLQEAEEEATSRIQSQLRLMDGPSGGGPSEDDDEERGIETDNDGGVTHNTIRRSAMYLPAVV